MSLMTAETWLAQTIKGDNELQALIGERVHIDYVPNASEYPLVVLSFISGPPVTNLSADVVMFDEVWLVKVWVEGSSYIPAAAILEKIQALLHKASGSAANGIVIGCAQEELFRLAENEGDKHYKCFGQYFRIYTQ